MQSPALRSLLALLALAHAPLGAQQLTQTLPAGLENQEGNAATSYPFETSDTQRWHWVYAAEEFAAPYPIVIEQIELRPDDSESSWPLVGYRNLEVRMGTAAYGYESAGYQQSFDANWTSGTGTPFFSGIVLVNAGSSSASPGPWTIRISGTPFSYDPAAGQDFIIDLRTYGLGPFSNPLLHSIDAQSGSPGTNGGNRYGNRFSPGGAIWEFSNDELVPIVRITYRPADGLYPRFEATPRSGSSPLAVSFIDRSVSTAAGGVTSWAWDCDGDGIVDSNLRHPTFSYASCGRYSVSLTVTDGAHGSVTKTETSYIQVDPENLLEADFEAHSPRGAVPLSVVFYDRSVGNPTAWEWDFDNNGVVDSTLPEPTGTFPRTGPFNVRLTVRNACSSSSLTKWHFVTVHAGGENLEADLLQYQFNDVRGTEVANGASTAAFPAAGLASGSGWMGDPGPRRRVFAANTPPLGSLGAHPVGGHWIDTRGRLSLSGSWSASFWLRRRPESTGTNPLAYVLGDGRMRVLLGGVAGASIGFRGTLVGDFYAQTSLAADHAWHHVVLVVDDAAGRASWYIDGELDATVGFLATTFAYAGSANLSLGANAGATPLTAHYDLDDFRLISRAATLEDVAACSWGERASATTIDPACTVGGATAILSTSARPRTASTTSLLLSGAAPLAPAAFMIGLDPSLGGLLPMPLPGVLDPACTLGVLPAVSLPVATDQLGGAAQLVAIPDEPLAWGVHVYAQVLVIGAVGSSSNVLDLNLQKH
ncbi:MAG: PKD domain-containing protein [Planctomycetes bacterium]|nr:PKD domain-containing protein [Planctomycetota bacterium]